MHFKAFLVLFVGGEIFYRIKIQTPSTQDIINRVADKWLQTVNPSSQDQLNEFVDYMERVRKVFIVDVKKGSLIFTLGCGSVQILDELWEDYSTGHLNEVAQSCLVTKDILEEFGLSSLKLTSNIKEEDYRACRQRLATNEGGYGKMYFTFSNSAIQSRKIQISLDSESHVTFRSKVSVCNEKTGGKEESPIFHFQSQINQA